MAATPKVGRADAEALVTKLQSFHESLAPNEQRALDGLLQMVEGRVTEPRAQELLAEFPEGAELLEDVAGFTELEQDPGSQTQLGPTVTVVTIATVMWSHPTVGCS